MAAQVAYLAVAAMAAWALFLIGCREPAGGGSITQCLGWLAMVATAALAVWGFVLGWGVRAGGGSITQCFWDWEAMAAPAALAGLSDVYPAGRRQIPCFQSALWQWWCG